MYMTTKGVLAVALKQVDLLTLHTNANYFGRTTI